MSVNRVILIGRLGQDPELTKTQSGRSLTKFSIATDREFSKENVVDWHNITAWEKTAEVIVQHCKKGKEVCIWGRIEYNKHEGKTYTNITVDSFHFIGKKEANGA